MTMPRLALAAALSLVVAGSTAAYADSSAAGPAAGTNPTIDPARSAATGAAITQLRRKESSATVTLVTGDQVRVTKGAGGPSVQVLPREGGTGQYFTRELNGDSYVIPASAGPALADGSLDPELFNVTSLVQQGFDDAHSDQIPLIAEYAPAAVSPMSAPGAPEGAERTAILDSIDAVAMTVDKDDATQLWADVNSDLTKRPAARSTSTLRHLWLDRVATSQLDRSTKQINAPTAWAAGLDGSGVKVAVLDTGVDHEHPDLVGQVVQSANFTGAGDHDENGHGTHTASTVAGTGAASGGAKRGVAPGADLMIGRVLDDNGAGYLSWIIEGMEWAVDSGADVVSMSLGGEDYAGCTDPLSEAATELGTKATFVVAAGNSGPQPHTVSSPACSPNVITVGAVDRDDTTAPFSSRGPIPVTHVQKPDIAAPGVGISAAATNGRGDQAYTTMSGTSMATPHVAGAAAILLQEHPDLTPAQVKERLLSSAETKGVGAVDQVGAGRVDVGAAVQADVYGPGAVNAGSFDWPQAAGASSQSDIQYTNTSDRAVTLSLAVGALEGNDRKPAPDQVVSLSQKTLTVPAGGTASVPLTIHPGTQLSEAQYGQISGRLVATQADGTTVSTPFSFWMQPKTVNLTIKVLGRDGAAPALAGINIINIDTGDATWKYLVGNDTVTAQVRAGQTYLDATVSAYDPGATSRTGMVDNVTLMTVPEKRISDDTTIVLDARDAHEVKVRGDRPLEDQGSYLGVGRWTDDWVFSGGVLDSGNINHVYASSVGSADTGKFDFHSLWRLGAPRLTMTTTGPRQLAVPAMYTTSVYAVDNLAMFRGNSSAPLVDAGTGTPDELAAAGARGKIVLIQNDTSWMSGQIAEDAAVAGAAGVLLYRPTPGRWSTGSSNSLPMATIEAATALELQKRLQAGPVTLRWQAQPYTPYMYNLAFHEAKRVPDNLNYRIDERKLAKVDTTWARLGEVPQTLEWANFIEPWKPDDHIAVGLPLRAPVPGSRVDYYSPGKWRRTVDSKPNQSLPMNGFRTFEAGQHISEDWYKGILVPTAGRVFETGEQKVVAVRAHNDILFDLSYGYLGDSDPNHWAPDMLAKGSVELLRNGESLGGAGALAGGFSVPAGDASYEFVLNTQPFSKPEPAWQRSTHVETRFGFRSDSTVGSKLLPLMFPGYQIDLDANNTAPARKQSIKLTVSGQWGYSPSIKDAALSYSYDGGQTWTDARVHQARGAWSADLDHRGASGKAVTLRVKLTGADGATVTQTTDDAYVVR